MRGTEVKALQGSSFTPPLTPQPSPGRRSPLSLAHAPSRTYRHLPEHSAVKPVTLTPALTLVLGARVLEHRAPGGRPCAEVVGPARRSAGLHLERGVPTRRGCKIG